MFISVTAPVVQPICQATRSRINAAGSEGTSRPERGDSMLDQSGCLCAETERVLYPKGPKMGNEKDIRGYTWIFGYTWMFPIFGYTWDFCSTPIFLWVLAGLSRPMCIISSPLGQKRKVPEASFQPLWIHQFAPPRGGWGQFLLAFVAASRRTKLVCAS